MLKKSTSGVLAGHRRLTISAAFTNVPRFIQRGVNLRGSTYHRARAARAAQGGRVRKVTPRARHCQLTISPARTDMALVIPRAVRFAAALFGDMRVLARRGGRVRTMAFLNILRARHNSFSVVC
ncbi:MAG: hypothetical protein OJF51_001524 [Nitrospira sp.]|jgi:hypothetical protein|nr:MAG: hypothetical protein OJF51_001524 [Nitrospira sp.]